MSGRSILILTGFIIAVLAVTIVLLYVYVPLVAATALVPIITIVGVIIPVLAQSIANGAKADTAAEQAKIAATKAAETANTVQEVAVKVDGHYSSMLRQVEDLQMQLAAITKKADVSDGRELGRAEVQAEQHTHP